MTPGQPQLTPQMVQQFIQAMQARQQQPQGGPTGVPQTGQPQASPSMQAAPGGGGGAMPAAQPAQQPATLPGIPVQSPRQPASSAQMQFRGVPAMVMGIKSGLHDKKVQKAQAMTLEYLAMSTDPSAKAQIDKISKADPKMAQQFEKKKAEFAKMYDKAMADPNSPEAQGIQKAYQARKMEEQQQQEFQQKQQTALAMERERQAKANQSQAVADTTGKYTQKDQGKDDARMRQVTEVVQGKLKQSQQNTEAMLKAAKIRTDALIQSAKIHAGASVKGAKIRADASNTLVKEYTALSQQASDLDKQEKTLTTHLEKNTHWWGDGDDAEDIKTQIQEVETKRQVLQQQYQMLQSKDAAFQKAGIIAPNAAPTSGSGPKVYDMTK